MPGPGDHAATVGQLAVEYTQRQRVCGASGTEKVLVSVRTCARRVEHLPFAEECRRAVSAKAATTAFRLRVYPSGIFADGRKCKIHGICVSRHT